MLRIKSGHDTRYLTDEVAAGREGYYTDAVVLTGEPPGRWYGRAAKNLGLVGEVDADLLEAMYRWRADPRDPAAHSSDKQRWRQAARLGPAPRCYRSAEDLYEEAVARHPDAGPELREQLRVEAERRAHQAVSFYDFTFSASKTVSMLWAACAGTAEQARVAGNLQEAEVWGWRAGQVEAALMTGARAVVDYTEQVGCYARVGHHGGGAGRWVKGQGLVAAMFLQHDSRNHDPHLHVHIAVDNLVQRPDGAWVALDGKTVHHARGAIAAVGERACEADLFRRLGVVVTTRPDGKAREVLGASTELADAFSSRDRDIEAYMARAVARFVAVRGREPTGREREEMHERAFLATRPPKSHEGLTRAEQLKGWDAQARTVRPDGLVGEARAVFALAAREHAADEWSPEDVIDRALASVAGKHAKWTRWQLLREVSDALPGHLDLPNGDQLPKLLDALTGAALVRAVQLTPQEATDDLSPELLREDGASVYAKPGGTYYATREQLAAEDTLRHAATAGRGAVALSLEQANTVLANYAQAGRELGADQAAALRGALTSGAFLEVVCAPAGTGKSFTVAALADAWRQLVGHQVFGLAPSQAAAGVLEGLAADGLRAANVKRWLDTQTRLDTGGRVIQPGDEALRLHCGDLVVVDEAGMAATEHLLQVHQRCEAAGAKLLLVGDPKQLGAVGPEGALADLAQRAVRYDLVEVRRFTETWEGPASLALRDGDTDVVGEYDRRGRLVDGGTPEEALRAAGRAWLADTLAGLDSLLLVGSNEDADRIAAALRQDLVAHGRVQPGGVWLASHGTYVGVGDVVAARRNAWHLAGYQGNGYVPVNRETYRVLATGDDGGLVVARVIGRDPHTRAELCADPIRLPGSYVGEHIALAYASTVHAAEGRTVDTGYPVIGSHTDLHSLYPALTRGRDGNRAYVITRTLSTDQQTGERQDLEPTTARALVASILEAADAETAVERELSARSYEEHAAEQAASLMRCVDRLAAEIANHTARRAAAVLDRLAAEGALSGRDRVALAVDEHYPSLLARLRTAELTGHHLDTVLTDAVGQRDFHQARSIADVLHGRIGRALPGYLTPRLSRFADLLPPGELPEPLATRWRHLAAAAEARRVELGRRLAERPPGWAWDALGPVPEKENVVQRAVWEHKAGWAAAYGELVGHRDPDTNPLATVPPRREAEKMAVWRTARAALNLRDANTPNPATELSVGVLRARYRAGERARDAAPRYVTDDELAATAQELHARQADAVLWASRAAATTNPRERDQHTAAAEQARRRLEEVEQVHRILSEMADARAEWVIHHAHTLEQAALARTALADLGIDPDDPETQTSAAGWLSDQHQRRADTARHATRNHAHRRRVADEHDLADGSDERAARAAGSGNPPSVTSDSASDRPPRAVEATAVDPADGPTRHPSEDRDHRRQHRRVPSIGELAADLGRARTAREQLVERRRADAARHAEAAWDSEAAWERSSHYQIDEDERVGEHELAADDGDHRVAEVGSS